MKYLLTSLMFMLSINLAGATDRPLTIDPQLDLYLIEGLEKSPQIASTRYRSVQATAGIGAAGSLPDPKLAFVFNNYPVNSFADDETPMTGKIIKLSQAIPYPGKLAAKEAVAEARSAAMVARLHEEGLLLRRNLVQSWNDLLFKRELVTTVEKKLQALDDFQRFIEARYAVGKSGQQDVLNIQISRTEAMNALSTAKRQAKGAEYEFNRLLDRPSEQAIETAVQLTPYADPSMDADSLAGIETDRPMFRLFRARIDESQQRVELADLQGWPDFSLGAGYTFREDNPMYNSTDLLSIEFGITLPFVNRSRVNSERAQAAAALQAARSDYHNLLTNEQMRVYDLEQQLQQLQERIVLYREGIVPQSQQGYEASLAAYQVGRYELSSLLKNLLGIYSAEIEELRAVADYNKTVAAFRYRIGSGSKQIRSLMNSNLNLSVISQ
jgi:outer membrane protein TolC